MQSLRSQLTWPLLSAAIFAAVFSFYSPRFFPVIGLAICVSVAATIVQEYIRGVQARRHSNPQENILVAMFELVQRNGQRYGGYIVHLGVVMLSVAVIGNGFYQSTTEKTLAVGESANLGGYSFTCTGLEAVRDSNRMEYQANLAINPLRVIGIAHAKRNNYDKAPDMPNSEVGLIVRPSEDLYVVPDSSVADAELESVIAQKRRTSVYRHML